MNARSKAGYTLVVVIVFAGGFGALAQGNRLIEISRDETRAYQILQSDIEDLHTLNWAEDTPSGVKVDPPRATDDSDADLPDAKAPPFTADYTTLAPGDIGDPSASWNSDPDVYVIPTNVIFSGSDIINVMGPKVMIVDGNFSFSGKA